MKTVLLAAALALAAPAALADLKPETPPRAAPTADSRLKQALAERKGTPVIINFWSSWCEPCREEMPALQRLADRWRARGVSVLTVAVADKQDRYTDFLWEASVILPALGDPDQATARAWGVRALPTTLVLDKRHRIVARARGVVDWDAKAIDAQLAKLLK